VAFAGLVIAAFAYWLISQWPVDLLAARHDFGLFTLPTMDVDLALAGFGLGIVIGPLTSAALRVVPAPQHGIASSLVVVARMTGMLVGVAALSAWGLYRFNQHLQSLPKSAPGGNLLDTIRIQADNYRVAYAMQYGEIFAITAVVCVVGALLGLFISGKNETAETPADDPDANPDEAEAVRATR
jgi:hypothetical protein